MNNKKKIYYWASNEINNNGEGILASNFLYLAKKNLKKFKFVPINKFKNWNQGTIFYKYILPLWAILLLWKNYILGRKVSYINFLPVWNFILLSILPPNTLLGPVTGSFNRVKANLIIKYFTFFGLAILKIRYKKVLFSHDFFLKYFKDDKRKFYNFLLYKFKLRSTSITKKYDYIFYIKRHNNKMNDFSLKLISELSEKYKICVIGENIISKENVFNMGFVNRNKALKLIKLSKAAVSTPENLFSFFLLDCLSYKLVVFYNKDFNPKKVILTNLLVPINFKDYKKSIQIIKKHKFNKNKKKIIVKLNCFNNYFTGL